MLLGKKAKFSIESEWAVILDRPASDFSKNRAVDKLAELFSLSAEEAKDLVANTPLILLDHLSMDLAERIKGQFLHSNVDCSLTNDTFTKRKCFRAVWPEQPNLARFVNGPSLRPNDSFYDSQQIAPKPPVRPEEPIPVPDAARSFSDYAADEQKQLKELTLDLQRENEMLRHQLENVEDSVREEDRNRTTSEIEKLRSERLQMEESVVRLQSENILLTSKVRELERNLKVPVKPMGASELEPAVKSHIAELRTQLEHFRSEYTKAQSAMRVIQGEAKQFQTEWIQTQKTLSEARIEIEDLKRMLGQAQTNSVQLKEETDRIHQETRSKLQELSAELDEWKRKANDWSASYFKIVKENEFLRAHQAEELESLRVRNQQLGLQLEQAQRQIKDFVTQTEQQDLIQKRMKAAQDLAGQEAELKILVQKQQTLETEIRLREEEMKKVLSEQEIIEREIVNAKQAQKYLLEQVKMRERSRFIRQKGSGSSSSDPRDAGSAPPAAD